MRLGSNLASVLAVALLAACAVDSSDDDTLANGESELTARSLAGQELRELAPGGPYRVISFTAKGSALAYRAESRATGEAEEGTATLAKGTLVLAHGNVTEEYGIGEKDGAVVLAPASADLRFSYAKAAYVRPPWPGLMPPSGYRHMVRLDDGRLFAFSVHAHPQDGYFDEVAGFEFAPEEGVWKTIPSMPKGVRFGGSLRVVGTPDGRVVFGSSAFFRDTSVLVELDTKKMTWSIPARQVADRASYGLGVCPDGNVLAFGGARGHSTEKVAFDPEGVGSKWSLVPSVRMHAVWDPTVVSTKEGLVYILGGTLGENQPWDGKVAGQAPIATAAVYDCTKKDLRFLAPMKVERVGHAATSGPDGRIYVLGGGRAEGLNGKLPVGEVYDPRTNTWSELAAPPLPGGSQLLPAPDGTLWFGGGSTTVYDAFDPATGLWTSGLTLAPVSAP